FLIAILLPALLCVNHNMWAQDKSKTGSAATKKGGGLSKKESKVSGRGSSLYDEAKMAEQNYEVNEVAAANSFVRVGDELAAKGEYEKAETNYKRAIAI